MLVQGWKDIFNNNNNTKEVGQTISNSSRMANIHTIVYRFLKSGEYSFILLKKQVQYISKNWVQNSSGHFSGLDSCTIKKNTTTIGVHILYFDPL